MERIDAEQASAELLAGRTLGNRQWPHDRTLSGEDMHQVTPGLLRALAGEDAADDWFVVPPPVTLSGDGSAEHPFIIDMAMDR